MKSDRPKTFGKLNTPDVAQPQVSSQPETRRLGRSIGFFFVLLFVAALHYLANAVVFDGQHRGAWFVQWWIIASAPFVTIYVHYNVPIKGALGRYL